MALDAHDGHDRDHERELELHQQGQDRAHRGQLSPAARQPVEAGQDGERPHRVHLPPDRRVEDRCRVEEVDRGGHQADARAAPAPHQPVPEAAAEEEEHPGHSAIGQDGGHLDQAGGDVHTEERLQP